MGLLRGGGQVWLVGESGLSSGPDSGQCTSHASHIVFKGPEMRPQSGLSGAQAPLQSWARIPPSASSTELLVYWFVFTLASLEGINLSVLFTLLSSTFIAAGTRQVSKIKC